MPRSIDGTRHNYKRKKVLRLAKGFRATRNSNYTIAKNAVRRALSYAYRDRKANKRNFRRLWISRISAAVAPFHINYSTFINQLNKANIYLNRKTLAYLAVHDPSAWQAIMNNIGNVG